MQAVSILFVNINTHVFAVLVLKVTFFLGGSKTLKLLSNRTKSDQISLTWERYRAPDSKDIVSFVVYYKEE